MARYIDADKLKEAFDTDTQHIRNWDVDLFDLLISEIEEAPTADVVEVVRCKDCKYFQFDKTKSNEYRWGFCSKCATLKEKTHFCAYRERRSE